MKIAYCIPALYNPGGMERVLTLKVNYFVEKYNYEIHIILTDGQDRPPYYPLHSNVIVHQLNINFDKLDGLPIVKKGFAYFYKQQVFKKKLRSCLFQVKPDITVSLLRRDINFINDIKDGSVKVGEIHFNRLSYRDFSSRFLPFFFQSWIKAWWNKQLINALRKLSSFVILSHEDAAYWPELSNVKVIHNPLSFYPERFSDLNNKQVIAVGRYVPQKGFDMLIEAWHKVVARHPDWKLKIYGDGMRDELEHQIDRLGLQKSCLLEHTVSNIVDKFNESSIFVLSSRYEGFGMVITEAMACGVPPIAFQCPCGPLDIIKDQIDGLLVENGNIELLAASMCRLIEQKEFRKRLGHNARINVKRFEIDVIASQWKRLFNQLIEK